MNIMNMWKRLTECLFRLFDPSDSPGARSKFWGVSGSEKDRDGDDNSIQFINIGRVGDKSFKEW